jgi:membrane protein
LGILFNIYYMGKKVKTGWQFAKQVIVAFNNDNVLKYSASLAYYTVFSIAPMIIIIIAVCGFLFNKQALQGEIYGQIKDLVGSDSAAKIQNTITNIHLSKNTKLASAIGIITLAIGATGIFGEIQDSLNKIWGLKIKPKRGLWKFILNRLLSFSLVLSLGFVLIVSLILNAIILSIGNRLNVLFPGILTAFLPMIEYIFSFIITTVLFAAIFKVLPDARIKWRDVGVGALVTSLLFMLGKFLIGYYLSTCKLTTMYGAAGSVIILLSWAYYSAAILYMGAEFTKVYVIRKGYRISPDDYSEWIKIIEVPVSNVTEE